MISELGEEPVHPLISNVLACWYVISYQKISGQSLNHSVEQIQAFRGVVQQGT